MAMYRLKEGTSVVIAPTKAEFKDNEEPFVNVKCTVERLGFAGTWHTRFAIYDSNKTLITVQDSYHTVFGVGEFIDSQSDNYNVGLGQNLAPGTYPLIVVVSAGG